MSYIENIYNTLLSIVLKKTKYFQINFLILKNVHLQKTSFYFTFSQSTVKKKMWLTTKSKVLLQKFHIKHACFPKGQEYMAFCLGFQEENL